MSTPKPPQNLSPEDVKHALSQVENVVGQIFKADPKTKDTLASLIGVVRQNLEKRK